MISIAMTTFNGQAYIEQQLQSILNQSIQADEIIICDDCSSDNTVSIIRKVMEDYPSAPIKLTVNKENKGYIKNFYQSIRLTCGDYIFLADQDDIWHTNKIERTLNALLDTNSSVVCTNFNLIDQSGNQLSDINQFEVNPFLYHISEYMAPISFHRLVFGNIVQGCTYCFTSAVREAYLAVDSCNLIHDYQIMFIGALIGKVVFLNEKLIDYRIHTSNAVGFKKKDTKKFFDWRIPAFKPRMVRYFDDLSQHLKIPYKWFYVSLYYFRIPYILYLLRRKFS